VIVQFNADMHYANEKLACAVHSMATSDLSLRERVLDVVRHHLIAVDGDDLPAAAREEFNQIKRRMSWAPSEGDGAYAATINRLDDGDVRKIAELIYEVHCKVVQALHDVGEEPIS
jgi:hypothetical protein